MQGGVIEHYGLPHSLYSGKTRAYLRYKGIPFREVPATLRTYKRFIRPRTGVSYIPVIRTPDDIVVQDTTAIIDFLEQRHPQPAVYPATPRQRLVALLMELYGDEWLLIPAMHYRWNFLADAEHRKDVLEHFGLLLGKWAPRPLRRWFGWKVCQPFKNALPLLGITEQTRGAIEAGYEAFLAQMDRHFAAYPYLLGGRASIGDFGLMGPLYAHLGRDPYPRRLMRARAPHVYAWVQRMNTASPTIGDWLPDDAIPDTLMPVLSGIFREHFPVLADTVQQVDRWLEEHGDQRLPRRIGRHRFRIGAAEGERSIFPYAQWMLQRPLRYYQGLAPEARPAVDAMLRACDGWDAMQLQVRRPLRRHENHLVPESMTRAASRTGPAMGAG